MKRSELVEAVGAAAALEKRQAECAVDALMSMVMDVDGYESGESG